MYLTGSKILLTEKLRNGALVTPTPGELPCSLVMNMQEAITQANDMNIVSSNNRHRDSMFNSFVQTNKKRSRAPIQYKDDILPVYEIPLWR